MIDFSLTEEQLAIQKTARDFANKEIKPIAAELDRTDDPERKAFWNVIRKATKLGFNRILLPEKYGGMGMTCVDWLLILEELAVADLSVALQLFTSDILTDLIVSKANENQRAKWLKEMSSADIYPISIGAIEPDWGGAEMFNPNPSPDPKHGVKCFAERTKDGYVINGAKSAFVTNGGHAKAYIVFARTDRTMPPIESTSLFYFSADTPGISVVPTEKLGTRALPTGQLFLDDVRVPKDSLIGKEGKGLQYFGDWAAKKEAIALGALFVGVARAAFEYSLDYAKNRVTWGQPMIKHQAVAMQFADMQIEIEAARLLAWRAAWSLDTQPDVFTTKADLVKVFNTEVAVRVALKALNSLGGYGYTTAYPMEKYLRDALLGPIGGGPNNMWRLGIAAAL